MGVDGERLWKEIGVGGRGIIGLVRVLGISASDKMSLAGSGLGMLVHLF